MKHKLFLENDVEYSASFFCAPVCSWAGYKSAFFTINAPHHYGVESHGIGELERTIKYILLRERCPIRGEVQDLLLFIADYCKHCHAVGRFPCLFDLHHELQCLPIKAINCGMRLCLHSIFCPPLQQSCWSGFYGYRLWYPTIGWFWNSGYLTSGSVNFWRKLSRPPDPPGICGSGIQPSVINWLFNFWISELLAETLPALAALISWLRWETMKSVITPFSWVLKFGSVAVSPHFLHYVVWTWIAHESPTNSFFVSSPDLTNRDRWSEPWYFFAPVYS